MGWGGLQAVEIGDGLLRLGGGSEDGPWIGLHDLEPMVDVAGVIGVRLDGDAEPGAEEGGADLGAGFLEAVGVIAEALAELPVQAVSARRPNALPRVRGRRTKPRCACARPCR